MKWYLDGILISSEYLLAPDAGETAPKMPAAPAVAPPRGAHHFPGRHISHAQPPSATHERYPGHRHAVKRYEREQGVGRTGTVGALADVRKTHAAELEKNPRLKQDLYDLAEAESGGQGPRAKHAFIESVFNRAASRGQTLDRAIHDHGYYPKQTTRKIGGGEGPAADDILSSVVAGSNVSNLSTGNASGRVGFSGGPQTYDPGTGERFGTEGADLGWAREMRKAAGTTDRGGEHRHYPGHRPAGADEGAIIPGPGNQTGLRPEFRAKLNAMYKAAPEDVRSQLSIQSGYRSPEHQAALFAASDRSGHMVAKHSRHSLGIAADLGFGPKGMNATGRARDWVHEHAAEHGLHFPMSWEPWHIEPMGSRE